MTLSRVVARTTKDEPPPDPAIAYIWERSLYVMDEDASNQTQFKRLGVMGGDLCWSPDGTQLAILTEKEGLGVHVINVDGTDVHRVVATAGYSGFKGIAWSPLATADGSYKIAFADRELGLTTGNRDIYVVNLDGKGLQNLTNTPDADEWSPTWSPNARRLAVEEHGAIDEIVVYDVGSDGSGGIAVSNPVYLTEEDDVPDGPLNNVSVDYPRWANNENSIAVRSQGAMWIIPVGDPANAYSVPSLHGNPCSWSPDDSKILYTDGAGEALWVITLSTGESTLLLDSGRKNGKGGAWRRNP